MRTLAADLQTAKDNSAKAREQDEHAGAKPMEAMEAEQKRSAKELQDAEEACDEGRG